MKITRFQTDHRLWLLIALALLLVSWCFPIMPVKGDWMRPVVFLWGLLAAIFHSDLSGRELFGVSAVMILFACLSAIVSIVVAWFIQCAIVIARAKKHDKTDHVA
jgi:hypothetical protein